VFLNASHKDHSSQSKPEGTPNIPTPPFASIIVPIYKCNDSLPKLLSALESQTYPKDLYEVILVNNDPYHNLSDIRNLSPSSQVILEPIPGSYQARNAGIDFAKGEILVFTDCDCIPDATWLANGISALQKQGKTGIVGGRIDVTFRDPSRPTATELYDSVCSFRQKEFVKENKYALTANLFTWKSVLTAVGPFDTHRKSGGDCEWGARVFRYGIAQSYCDAAVVRHPARRTLSDLIRKSRRVTIGTMETLESFNFANRNFLGYLRHQVIERPTAILRGLNGCQKPLHNTIKLKVLALYFFIKVIQVLERVRVSLGGHPLR
jgi:cellulose synthase/poly-beta-1,6-N-acetylglucosamine synthase-like glycosyltransferase